MKSARISFWVLSLVGMIPALYAQTFPEMVLVPGGTGLHGGGYQYWMDEWQIHYIGEDTCCSALNQGPHSNPDVPQTNNPPFDVSLPSFYLSEHEVTNRQYRDFLAYSLLDEAERNQLKKETREKNSTPPLIWRQLVERALQAGLFPDTACWLRETRMWPEDEMARYYFFREESDDYPVVGVSWEQAQQYCSWLTLTAQQKKGDTTSPAVFRLPTESEWEYASRYTSKIEKQGPSDYYAYPLKGQCLRDKKGAFLANYHQVLGHNSEDEYPGPSPVKTYPPHYPGIYDLGGNVAEWTQDVFIVKGDSIGNAAYWRGIGVTQPEKYRVVKGGSWADPQYAMNSGSRTYLAQNEGSSRVGFRVARAMTDTKPVRHTF